MTTRYEKLHDGLSDMIESGRLTEADIPDDYAWLVRTLAGDDGDAQSESSTRMFQPKPCFELAEDRNRAS